jgi:hypothetical protein
MSSDSLARRYLLGELAADERQSLEERLFTDDDWFAELQDAENDLLDSYAAGKLSGADREHVERLLLGSASQRQRVALVRPLLNTLQSRAPRSALPARAPILRPWHRFAVSALAASLVVSLAANALLSSWLLRTQRQPGSPLVQRADRTISPARDLRLRAAPLDGPEIATLFLRSVVRDEAQTVHLPPQVQILRIQVPVRTVDRATSRFRAEILDFGRNQVLWRHPELRPEAHEEEQVVNLLVPTSALHDGSFEVRVFPARATPASASQPDYDSHVLVLSSSR